MGIEKEMHADNKEGGDIGNPVNNKIQHGIRQRAIELFAGFLIFVILAIITFTKVQKQYSNLRKSSGLLKEEISQKLQSIDRVNQNSVSLYVALLEYEAAPGEPQKSIFKNAIDSLHKKNTAFISKIDSLVSSPEERKLFENFKLARSKYVEKRSSYFLLNQQGIKAEQLQYEHEDLKKLFENLRATGQAFTNYEHLFVVRTASESSLNVEHLGRTMAIIVVGCIAISILSVIVAFRLYSRLMFHYQELEEILAEKEKALAEKKMADRRPASILNALPANIALLNNRGVIVDVNDSWKAFSAAQSKFTGNNYGIGSDYINAGNDHPLITARLREMIGGKVKKISMIYPSESAGKKRWFRIIATRENDNRNSGIVLMQLDITERQESEEKIRQSEANLRQIIDLVPHLIFVKDMNGAFILANRRIGELYGVTTVDLLNEKMREFVPVKDEGERFTTEDAEVMASGKRKIMPEAVFTDYTGEKHLFHTTKVPYVPTGSQHNAVLCVGIEITAQKKAEQALQKSEANLRSIFNHTDIAFILLDKSFIILSCNEIANSWAEFAFGTRMQEGVNLLSLVSAERQPESLGLLSLVLAGNSIDEDAHYTLLNSSVEWYRVRMNPVRDNEENIIGVCLSATNITVQKTSEMQSIQLTKDLIQRNKDLEQFAYIVSHNLRAPVANIIGITDILHSMEHNQEEYANLKTDLATSVEKLDNVIKDLGYILQVKREVSEKKELVLLSELTADIILSIDDLIRKEQVSIVCNFSEVDELLTLKSYLYSIFFNLITNSIKYRQPNISPVIEIKSEQSANKIELYFKDNGIGIDLERRREQLFGLYKRFHNHTEGKGMGLYMVKAQVETLGGKISVHSEVNKGTEFRIEFGT